MQTRRTTVALLIAGCLAYVVAQDAPAVLAVAVHPDHGPHLVDQDGRSLYLFLNDQPGEASACYDTCAQSWPPLLTSGDVTAGEGVDASLLGTLERTDSATQVTYNGWPLYRFVRDRAPGDALGQGLGSNWYLVTPAGQGAGLDAEDETLPEDVLALGGQVFQERCSGCHGPEGGGAEAPRLANNTALRDVSHVLRQVMRGGDYMPAFGNLFSDEEIAAVATYVRNSWGNDFGLVTVEEVSSRR